MDDFSVGDAFKALALSLQEHVMSNSEEARFNRLLSSDSLKLDLYKYYEDKVEKIRSRLWTTLAWIATLEGAVLTFMFDKLSLKIAGWPSIQQPKVALILSIFGFLFAIYTLKILDYGTEHIENNWRRADLARQKTSPYRRIKSFRQRIKQRSFTEFQVMRRLFLVVAGAQILLAALSLWSWAADPSGEPARSSTVWVSRATAGALVLPWAAWPHEGLREAI